MGSLEVSFIIPAYNSEKTIIRCINSIQDIKFPHEIIVVDDGSTDNTKNIIKKISLQKNNLNYIHTDNSGVSSARNVGLESAKGKYVVFLDSDDELISKTYNYMLQMVKDCNLDWIKGNYYINKITSQKEKKMLLEYYGENIVKGLVNFDIGYVWGKVYVKRILDLNHISFDEKMSFGEDLEFNLRYSRYVNNIGIASAYCNIYYMDRSSLSRKYLPDYLEVMEKIKREFLILSGYHPEFKDKYEEKFNPLELITIDGFIRNCFRNEGLRFFQKYETIKKLMSSLDIDRNMIPIGFKFKILYFLLKTRNSFFISVFYYFLNMVKG
jgi:glycosyltransferase involved in cell wall biosynthesis